MQIGVSTSGSFNNLLRFLKRVQARDHYKVIDACAKQGVEALRTATPKDSGLTAESWGYEIEVGADTTSIIWTNSNVANGWFPVAIMLQMGHGTGTGGYVQGQDYINPAIRPVFDNIANTVWEVVRSL